MSIRWESFDQRERAKKDQEKALKEFLKAQNEEDKKRKLLEKRNDAEQFKKITQIEQKSMGKSNSATFPVSNTAFVNTAQNVSSSKNFIQYSPKIPSISIEQQPKFSFFTDNSTRTTFPPSFSNTFNPTTQVNSNTDIDLGLKFQNTEEALQGEKRARLWLESEVQAGKNMLASLTARVDKLQEKSNHDDQKIRELAKVIESSDLQFKDLCHQISSRTEKENVKVQQLLNDMISKQRLSDNVRQELETQNRALCEQVNHLRYKLEGYIVKTEQVGSDLDSKDREWKNESQKSSEALRAVKTHDQALQSLHSTLDSNTDNISRKFDAFQFDIKQRFENEIRARQQFETNMRDICSEWRKTVQNQERELIERIDSTRQYLITLVQSESDQRTQLAAVMTEAQRTFQKDVNDAQSELMEKIAQEFKFMGDSINDEKQMLKQTELRVQTSCDETISLLEGEINKKLNELQEKAIESRKNIAQVAKTLQDSILISEKTSNVKIKSLEDVLRAEVKSRMDTDATISSMATEIKSTFDLLEKKSTSLVEDLQDQFSVDFNAIKVELKQLSEKSSESAENSLAVVELDIERLQKSIKQQESIQTERLEQLKVEQTQLAEEVRDQSQQLFDQVKNEIGELNNWAKDISNQFEEVELNFKTLSTHVEEKFNFKTKQLDSTMDAFKQELESCAKNSDLVRLDDQFAMMNSRIKEAEDHVQSTVESFTLTLSDKISKDEFNEYKLGQKDEMISLKDLVVTQDSKVIELSEKTDTKLDKQTFVELDSKVKDTLAQFKLNIMTAERELEITKALAEKAIKNESLNLKISEFEESLKETDLRADEMQKLLAAFENGISERALSTVVEENKTKFQTQLEEINQFLNQLQSVVKEVKDEIATGDGKLTTELHEEIEKQGQKLQKLQNDLKKGKEEAQKKSTEVMEQVNKKLSETAASVESIQSKQFAMISQLQLELQDRSKLFQENLREVHISLDQISDGKDDVREELEAQINDLKSKCDQMEEVVSSKCQISDLEHLKSEFETEINKQHSKHDVDLVNFEQLKVKLTDQDEKYREKMQNILQSQERNNKEQASNLRHLRENLSRKLDELDSRMKRLPSATEAVSAELRELRKELHYVTQNQVSKIEAEIAILKSDMKYSITDRQLDASIASAISPLQSRIDQILDNTNSSAYKRSSNNVGNFYKPQFPERSSSAGKPYKNEEFENPAGVPLQHTPSTKEF